MDTAKEYDKHAEDWARRMRSGANAAHRYLEKPAMAALIPTDSVDRVLALGCGSGEECDLLMSKGARRIEGIDISPELIQSARLLFPQHDFHVGSIEDLRDFPKGSFTFVYSSLVFHYLQDWRKALAEAYEVLEPGGRLLLSTHHPVKWGAQSIRGATADEIHMGYLRPKEGSPIVFGDYLKPRRVVDTWFGNMEVTYYHRPMQDIFEDILSSGFQLEKFVEPMPTPETQSENPYFWEIHSKIPLFMIFLLRKPELDKR